jgi:beta-glucosidase
MSQTVKQILGTALMAGALGAGSLPAAEQPDVEQGMAWSDRRLPADERARRMVEAMTLDEQIALMRTQPGFGLGSAGIPLPPTIPEAMRKPTPPGALGSAGFVPAIERLGLPVQQMSDAGMGVANLGGILRRGDEATALPATLALASSFDAELARRAGAMLGAEARAKGFNVQLAGGVNLVREPRNGRNFEYAGEDPLLAGTIAGEQIAGIQSRHMVSTTKHYALNAQETGRFVHDAQIDEAALRESDLLAFKIAIDLGRPGAVMCAYNRINGDYACENGFLLDQVLRQEWKYPGWVMSDWGAVHSLEPALAAGLDQESPQDHPYFAGLKDAVEQGRIPAARVAESATRIVRSLIATGVVDDPAAPGGAIDRDADAAIAEEVAVRGAVLLRNDGVLPLAKGTATIAVIGGFADRGVLVGGGGSSSVRPYGGSFTDPRGLEGLKALLAPVYGTADAPLAALQRQFPAAELRFDDGTDPARAARLAAGADAAIVFATRPETEGKDAPGFELPYAQDALIAQVAAARPHTVVVLETGNPVAMPWLADVGAVLQAWYPGQRGGTAIARLISGDAAPEGRLPMSFPASAAQLPRPAIPGAEQAGAKENFLASEGIASFPVVFNEGSDVGYRWYERTGAAPLFAFGHGLTYTTFAYQHLRAHGGKALSVDLTVRNTGTRAGVEIAQLYVAPPGRTHRLAGWARVALQPGQSAQVTIQADPHLLASWSRARGWHREAGTYDLYVGRAAGQRDLAAHVALEAADAP